MNELAINNKNTNITCYDDFNLIHASNDECVVIDNNQNAVNIKEILYRLWNFNENEKQVFNVILSLLNNNEVLYKNIIVKNCSIIHNKNKITYERAINSLKERNILIITANNVIIVNNNYDIYNNVFSKKTVKYVVINV